MMKRPSLLFALLAALVAPAGALSGQDPAAEAPEAIGWGPGGYRLGVGGDYLNLPNLEDSACAGVPAASAARGLALNGLIINPLDCEADDSGFGYDALAEFAAFRVAAFLLWFGIAGHYYPQLEIRQNFSHVLESRAAPAAFVLPFDPVLAEIQMNILMLDLYVAAMLGISPRLYFLLRFGKTWVRNEAEFLVFDGDDGEFEFEREDSGWRDVLGLAFDYWFIRTVGLRLGADLVTPFKGGDADRAFRAYVKFMWSPWGGRQVYAE